MRLSAAVFLCALAASAGCRRQEPAACERPLVVATYNIRFDDPDDGVHRWANRAAAVGDLARGLEADLLGMQEVLPHQLDELERMLGEYRREGEGRDGPRAGEASPLFYRAARFERLDGGTFWLSPTPDRPRRADEQKPWGTWLNRVASWALLRDREAAGRRVLAINTHLDHASETARRESAALLVDFVARHPADAVVLMGDLNARPDSEPHRRIAAALRDAARAPEVLPAPTGTTVTRWTELGPPDHHIDHIFTRGARPLRYEVLDRRARYQGADRYPSDHLPVRARLCLE
ncbi:MAG TPA: endonuclease/exonuclease/phosphatase family protein [Kofleriaceae bacterium]|nr:endonuclease/exonuclease/phosphatase family protein [Kofleriaceae bacterium]